MASGDEVSLPGPCPSELKSGLVEDPAAPLLPGPHRLQEECPQVWASSHRDLWRHCLRRDKPHSDVESRWQRTGREPGQQCVWSVAESRGRWRPQPSRHILERASAPRVSVCAGLLSGAVCPPLLAAGTAVWSCLPHFRGAGTLCLTCPPEKGSPGPPHTAPLPFLELGGGAASASLPYKRLSTISGERRLFGGGGGRETVC